MFAIKRKEPVVDAVRRIGRERLDRALAALDSGEADALRERTIRETRRALSLVAVVGPAMDVEAVRRERSALRRVLRATERPSVGDVERRRCVWALQDARMRAGYWHVEGQEFAALRPGLMRVVGRARRGVRAAAAVPDDAALGPGLIEALRTYGHALRLVERSWPELLGAERARLEALSGALRAAEVSVADAAAARVLVREAAGWMSETPGRWCDRLGGYWVAWRTGRFSDQSERA